MKIKLLFFFIVTLISLSANAQTEVADQPAGLEGLISSRTAQRKNPDAKMDGYHILIIFDENRSKAEAIRNKFIAEFSNKYDADVIWDEPNFKVYVGVFKTKLEAQELLNLVKDNYPTAILVKDKLKFPKI
ncbi:MAG: SPOR domain-containing protein [Bacteroidia bacterium]|nr:SPOR domain-containing protein [Bacteroidia bacterium]